MAIRAQPYLASEQEPDLSKWVIRVEMDIFGHFHAEVRDLSSSVSIR